MKQKLFNNRLIVFKKVAQLVILHEEGADGNALPPLDAPIGVVQKAVANLQKVGEETVQESSDLLLKRDMPPALDMVQVLKCQSSACLIFLGCQ